MSKRAILGLVLVLLATLLVAAPAAAEDLAPAQLCDLFPQDQGFAIAADSANGGCAAEVGDCAQPAGTFVTCVSGFILQKASSQEARSLLPTGGPWSAQSGLGEVAISGCDPFFCEVRFQRDRFWVSAVSAPGLGLPPALALAAEVDQAILAILASAPPPATGNTSENTTATTQPEATAPRQDYGDVFFGTAGLTALYPDIDAFIACGTLTPSGDVSDCEGARAGFDAQAGAAAAFHNASANPSQRALDGMRAWSDALFLGGIKADDGSDLFPSVVRALPVIERLPDPAVAQRLLEMLAAMDVAAWEDRY